MLDNIDDLIKEIEKEFKDFKNMTPIEKSAYIGMYMQRKLNCLQKE